MILPQGLKAANKQDTVLPFLDGMVEFLHRSAADENRTSEVLKACVGLLGDLGQTFGSKMQQLYQMPFVPMLLQQAQQQGDDDIQEVAQWTQSVSSACLVRCVPHALAFCRVDCYGWCCITIGLILCSYRWSPLSCAANKLAKAAPPSIASFSPSIPAVHCLRPVAVDSALYIRHPWCTILCNMAPTIVYLPLYPITPRAERTGTWLILCLLALPSWCF
jgi:hypothetical protein